MNARREAVRSAILQSYYQCQMLIAMHECCTIGPNDKPALTQLELVSIMESMSMMLSEIGRIDGNDRIRDVPIRRICQCKLTFGILSRSYRARTVGDILRIGTRIPWFLARQARIPMPYSLVLLDQNGHELIFGSARYEPIR